MEAKRFRMVGRYVFLLPWNRFTVNKVFLIVIKERKKWLFFFFLSLLFFFFLLFSKFCLANPIFCLQKFDLFDIKINANTSHKISLYAESIRFWFEAFEKTKISCSWPTDEGSGPQNWKKFWGGYQVWNMVGHHGWPIKKIFHFISSKRARKT